jgi:hypothetical protein
MRIFVLVRALWHLVFSWCGFVRIVLVRFRFPKLLERERKHREALRREGGHIEADEAGRAEELYKSLWYSGRPGDKSLAGASSPSDASTGVSISRPLKGPLGGLAIAGGSGGSKPGSPRWGGSSGDDRSPRAVVSEGRRRNSGGGGEWPPRWAGGSGEPSPRPLSNGYPATAGAGPPGHQSAVRSARMRVAFFRASDPLFVENAK